MFRKVVYNNHNKHAGGLHYSITLAKFWGDKWQNKSGLNGKCWKIWAYYLTELYLLLLIVSCIVQTCRPVLLTRQSGRFIAPTLHGRLRNLPLPTTLVPDFTQWLHAMSILHIGLMFSTKGLLVSWCCFLGFGSCSRPRWPALLLLLNAIAQLSLLRYRLYETKVVYS